MKELDLTQGNIYKTMIKFAIPFLLAILLQACYGAADLLIVGQFGDSVQQSAVATGTQIMNMVTNLIVGLASGATILIAQYMGEGRKDKVSGMIGTCFTVSVFVSAMFTVIFTILSGPLTQLMNAPEEAAVYTTQYIFICSCGIFFIFGYNAVAAILRAMGDSKSPLLFVAIACVSNIVLDIILVSAGLGAAGAAIATISAQGISLGMSILLLKKRNFIFDFKLKSFKTTGKQVSLLLKTGIPVALQNSLVSVSFLILTSIINTFGVSASAAIGINDKFNSFFMLPAIAFSMAISAAVGQNIGAKKIDRAKKCFHLGLGVSLIFGVVFFLLLQLIPETMAGIFTNDAAVIEQAKLYIRSFSWDIILVCFVFCFGGFVNGTGKTGVTLANNILSTFGVRVPATFILSSIAGATLYEIGFAAPIASAVQIIVIFIYYRSGRWNMNNGIKKKAAQI